MPKMPKPSEDNRCGADTPLAGSLAGTPLAPPRSMNTRTGETFRAGLEYVACDLRELAKIAPPDRAMQVLNLSRLVESLLPR